MREQKNNFENLSFCVVVPMYNEEGNAEKCMNTILDFLKEVNKKAALIVVNDGSKDSTAAILARASQKNPRIILENHPENKGYGQANLTGARRAFKEGFTYCLFMDADLTQNIKYLFVFLEEMQKDTDFIKATRYAKGGGVKGVCFRRYFVSLVGNFIAKTFLKLPLTDYTNGFRAVKTNILEKIQCEERGFAYLIEEVYKASKITKSFSEVPYILTLREDNASRSKFKYSLGIYYKYLRWLFKK